MKILIISEYNKFSSVGGTENYVNGLVEGLVKLGHSILLVSQGSTINIEILTVTPDSVYGDYELWLLPRLHFKKSHIIGKVVSPTWGFIQRAVCEFNPDVIHVHTISTFFNFSHLKSLVNIFNNKIFLTLHVPGHFCLQGDMIRSGRRPCDGVIGFQCVKCVFNKSVKEGFTNIFFGYHRSKLDNLNFLNENNINVITVSNWQLEQLLQNGLNSELIRVERQFLTRNHIQKGGLVDNKPMLTEKYKIGYLGRFSKEKGSELLLKVVNSFSKEQSVQFVLGCPSLTESDLLSLTIDNPNILIMNNINDSNKNEFFDDIDLLFIPSLFFETGPIVLLEAISKHTHVLAPNVGGTLEYSIQYQDWVSLYQWNDFDSVIKELRNLISKKDLIDKKMRRIPVIKYQEETVISHLEMYQGN